MYRECTVEVCIGSVQLKYDERTGTTCCSSYKLQHFTHNKFSLSTPGIKDMLVLLH